MWDVPAEGKPLPQAISPMDPYAQYYQAGLYPQYAMHVMEDMRMRRMSEQAMPYAAPSPPPDQSLLGLPGQPHHELMQVPTGIATPPPSSQMDPALLGYEVQPSYIDAVDFPPLAGMEQTESMPSEYYPFELLGYGPG